MRAMKISGLALAGTLAVAATAQAGYVSDGTMDRMFHLHNTYGANWVDRVGNSNPFELFGVNVSSSSDDGGTLNLSIYTNYGLNAAGPYQTRTADIAFKLDGATDFNFGLILVDHDTDASAARRDNNGLEAGFYAVNSWLTSEDIFGDLFGPAWEMMFGNAICANDTIFVTGVGIPPELPEPAAMGLMLLGLVGLGASRRVIGKA